MISTCCAPSVTSCIIDFNRAASAICGTDKTKHKDVAEQSNQLLGSSPLAAVLNSLPLSGMDPSHALMLQALMSGVDAIDPLHRELEEAMSKRRDEIVIKCGY